MTYNELYAAAESMEARSYAHDLMLMMGRDELASASDIDQVSGLDAYETCPLCLNNPHDLDCPDRELITLIAEEKV